MCQPNMRQCDSLAGLSWASRSMAPGFTLAGLSWRPGQWPLGFTESTRRS